MQSCASHFLGSFSIAIFPAGCKINVTNNSSFTSFSYGQGPSWSYGPMSNLYQTYSWDERL